MQDLRVTTLVLLLCASAGCRALNGLAGTGDIPVVEAGGTFVDDFSPPDPAWPVREEDGLEWRVDEEGYVADGRPVTAQLVTPRRHDAERPVRVDLHFHILEEPAERGGIFGVACLLTGDEETSHGYAAVVQASEGKAYYGLLGWEDKELVGIVPLDAPAQDFDYDGPNTLSLRCRPADGEVELELWLNDIRLASGAAVRPDDLPKHAQAGVYVDTSPLHGDERFRLLLQRFELEVE